MTSAATSHRDTGRSESDLVDDVAAVSGNVEVVLSSRDSVEEHRVGKRSLSRYVKVETFGDDGLSTLPVDPCHLVGRRFHDVQGAVRSDGDSFRAP